LPGESLQLFQDAAAAQPGLLIDSLLRQSRLYSTSEAYVQLLGFVARLRTFAPFNAMLLQVQKPGLKHAASAKDWHERFGRFPRERARPLLILRPFGPVALVYDLADTDGRPVPDDAFAFRAVGSVKDADLARMDKRLSRKRIATVWFDGGDSQAGSIRRIAASANARTYSEYQLDVNQNHPSPTQFVTLAHELAHLSLGHLGEDRKLRVSSRATTPHAVCEVEAESVAYLVARRFGVESHSESYLVGYIDERITAADLDVAQILKATGLVEDLLGIAPHQRSDAPKF
jgi:hypothetical protein